MDQVIRVNSQSGKAAATWILSRRWGLDLPVDLQIDFGRRVQMMCEALAREISHQEVINLFIASYALSSERHGTGNISVFSDGTLENVTGTVYPADGLTIRVNGSGSSIASAVIRGLHFMKGMDVGAEVCHTQQLTSDFDQGKTCALATCTEGEQTAWGYSIDNNQRTAQAMAVAAAALHLHRRKLSTLPLKKHGAATRMDAKAAPPQTITKA
ncbi:hypothetical protein CGMCC3_g7557 [Colletotrichum fructicola]|nr:uncharacterized protein CGMCC3_g7557 [Colletotrichum fructicola]KAE9576385.1 hypothetical protein CGMCC3_g7557 [Colletotrichum fructicola]